MFECKIFFAVADHMHWCVTYLVVTSDELWTADVNECTRGTDRCHPHATCYNTEGSYTCYCNPGYTGSGRSCIGNSCLFVTSMYSSASGLQLFVHVCIWVLNKQKGWNKGKLFYRLTKCLAKGEVNRFTWKWHAHIWLLELCCCVSEFYMQNFD